MVDRTDFPPLYAKSCSFYGSMETKNLCSKCYKDFLKESLVSEFEAKLKVLTTSTLTCAQNPCVSLADDDDSSSSVSSTLSKLKINRCQNCNKKVGLMGFSSRCGKLLCGFHRYTKEHSCSFDYKTTDRLVLAKENFVMKADILESRI
ncbi:hypothetical protein REPUB_Repub06bG0082000 [Reevesia pubescens]